ncbi:unnamed protein product, partial [Allacma fusca]
VRTLNWWASNAPPYVDPREGRPHRRFKYEPSTGPVDSEISRGLDNLNNEAESSEVVVGHEVLQETSDVVEQVPEQETEICDRKKLGQRAWRNTPLGRAVQRRRRNQQRFNATMEKIYGKNSKPTRRYETPQI